MDATEAKRDILPAPSQLMRYITVRTLIWHGVRITVLVLVIEMGH